VGEPLDIEFSVVYEDIENGWVMATIPEVPGAMSQGRTREEARDNVRDALRELLFHRANTDPDVGSTDGEPLRVTIAP
jgi:predicted RNase H-like HicB family nuclease